MDFITEKEIDQIKSKMVENSEFEIRFGTPGIKDFIPEVGLEEFINSIDYMDKHSTTKMINYSFIVSHQNNTRVTQVLEPPKNGDYLSYPWTSKIIDDNVITKQKIFRKDNCEYGLRFALANENKVEIDSETFKSPPVYFKVRKRFSYIFEFIQIDISMFKSSNDINKLTLSDYQYDIEIEVKKECKNSEIYYWIDTLLKIINKTEFILSSTEIKKVLLEYNSLVGKNTFIGSQPITLKESRFNKKQDYALTLKLDGRRHLLLTNNTGYYLIDNKMNIKCLLKEKCDEINLFDGELFEGVYYIFDILYSNNKDIRDLSFNERYKMINVKETDNIKVKEYIFDNIYNKIEEYYNETTGLMKDPRLDGFILVNKSKNYKEPPLKWKPEKLNTIDFKITKNLIDTTFEEWTLLCSDNVPFTFKEKDLSKVKIDKSVASNYINGSVVEFYYDNTFIPLRTRYDKVKGNYIKVAQDNFDTIMNPFNLKILDNSKPALFNMRRYHNWIKRKILEKYSVKTGNLLDLACGKGGDIYKWVDNNIRQVQGYDIDSDSINEARRRFNKVISKPTSKSFEYKFEVRDLSKDPCKSEILYDTVSCFFAIHYFYKDNDTLKTFTESLKNVKEGSHFIMTTLSSEKLKEIDYTLKNDHIEIMKKSFDPKEKLGNSISVFIKDSVLDIPREEYIVDYKYTIKLMEENSFKLVETKLFGEYYPEWEKNQNFLNSQEKEYSFLNRVYIFIKTNTAPTDTTLVLNRPLKGKNEWKLAELKKYCSENKLDTRGKKEQLFERIRIHLNVN